MLPAVARVIASNIVRYVRHGGLDAAGLQSNTPRSGTVASPLAPSTDSRRGVSPAKSRSSSAAIAPADGDAPALPPCPLLARVPSGEAETIGWASFRRERAKRIFITRFARRVGYSYSELKRLNRIK